MNKVIQNRIIGTCVLAITGLIFVPKILTPKNTNLTTPSLTVNIDEKKLEINNIAENNTGSNNVSNTDDANTALTLEGYQSNNPTIASTDNNPTPVTLEPTKAPGQVVITLEDYTPTTRTRATNAVITTPTTTPTVNNQVVENKKLWIRVASFSNMKNANKLAQKLKQNRLPVTSKMVTIANIKYKRIIVGPYENKAKVKKALGTLKAKGYKKATIHDEK